MKFDIKKGQFTQKRFDALIMGLDDKNKVIRSNLFDSNTLNHVNKYLKLGDSKNEIGKITSIIGNNQFTRILLINVGNLDLVSNKQLFKSFKTLFNTAKQLNIKGLALAFDQFDKDRKSVV